MRILILAAVAAFAFTSVADAKSCKDPATGKFVKCPVAAAAPAAMAKPATPMASPAMAAKPRECKKGKACGNSCIKATDICHKPAA